MRNAALPAKTPENFRDYVDDVDGEEEDHRIKYNQITA